MDLFSFSDSDYENEDIPAEENLSSEITKMENILSAIDCRNFDYYQNFGKTPEEQDKIWTAEAFPALRWLSCVGKPDWAEWKRQGRTKGDGKGGPPLADTPYTEYYLLATNEIANIHFWDISSSKKLQFMLLCGVGIGISNQDNKHSWLQMVKNIKAKDKFEEILYKIHPEANRLEIEILKTIYNSDEKMIKICKMLGMNDDEINEILGLKANVKKARKSKKV